MVQNMTRPGERKIASRARACASERSGRARADRSFLRGRRYGFAKARHLSCVDGKRLEGLIGKSRRVAPSAPRQIAPSRAEPRRVS